jgi:hypothetical protein
MTEKETPLETAQARYKEGLISAKRLAVEVLLDKIRKQNQDSQIEFGIRMWDSGNLNIARAVFEDENYHDIAEAIHNYIGGKA